MLFLRHSTGGKIARKKLSQARTKSRKMQDRFENQHPAAGPGLSGALSPLHKGGEEEQGYGKGLLGAMRDDRGQVRGKTKCGEVK